MKEDEFNILTDQMQKLQRSVDIIDRDLEKDREDIRNLVLRLGAVEAQVDEVQRMFKTHENRIGDTVEEATKPIIKEARDLKNVIKKKKMVVLETKTWLQRLLRR
jgi:predicted  nucleic acid-binding Zn-ribbon protein